MAFRSNGPVTLALPAFRGVTRQLILAVLAVYFGLLVLGLFAVTPAAILTDWLFLRPLEALGRMPWQLLTYPFVGSSLLGLLFALLSIWFFGSALEEERGSRWLIEYLLAATLGGALLATVLSRTLGSHIPGLGGEVRAGSLWPAVLALLLAYARFHANEQLNFNFILRIRAKYLAAIYLLIYLAQALLGGERFSALLALANALCGYAFLRLAPYAGVRAFVSERFFGARNAMLRAKRRRAAKKFAVYMRDQGRDVNIDTDGRYVAPEDEPRKSPDGKRWMN